jgi:hypothetical protein
MLGGELPNADLHIGSLSEGEVSLRRVNEQDQDRWRSSRHKLMRGYGALGDTDYKRAYPFLPIPEWLLDCCTVTTEIRAQRIDMPGELTLEPHEAQIALGFAGLDGMYFRATEVADVVRLLIEPHLQVVCEELLVTVESGSDALSTHTWTAPGFRQRHRQLRWSLEKSAAALLVEAWKSAAYGPNASVVRFPLRRLGVAAQRSFAEDQLIDLWVGLDGLFKKDKEGGRLMASNTARRAGALLNADVKEQRNLNKSIPRSYATRGALVHGRSNYTDEALEEAIEIADKLLRRSLAAVINKTEAITPSDDPPRMA